MYRTHSCGSLRKSHVGQTVTWPAGFIASGITAELPSSTCAIALDWYRLSEIPSQPDVASIQDARQEWVLQVTGVVRPRPAGAENPNLATGEIEVDVTRCTVLNPSKMLPFLVNKDEEINEEVRLKYRYLDLRREKMQTKFDPAPQGCEVHPGLLERA